MTDTPLQLFSAETKFGKDEVWQWIEARMHDQK
jgi:GTP-binding protein